MSQTFEDIRYEIDGPVGVITINRPHRYNAFRGRTVEELIKAFRLAWADKAVQVVILTGAGEKAFCTGGDVKQRAETGDYGPTESGMFEIGNLHKLIRDIPKPVIAAVNGIAVGGGHVLHVLCDLTIAVRDRPVRAGRPEGRLVRRRFRVRLPGQGCRREAGPGDLVPVPPVRRGDRRAVGPGQRRRAGRSAARRGQELGARDRREEPHRAAVPQAVVQRRHRSPGRPEQPRDVRARPVHRLPGGTGGRRRVRREATGRFRLSTSTGTDPRPDRHLQRREDNGVFAHRRAADPGGLGPPVRPGCAGPRIPGAGEGRADRAGGPAGDGREGFHRTRDLQGARRPGSVPADLRPAAGADLHRRLQRRLPAGGRLAGRPDPGRQRPTRGRRALGPADHQRRGHRRDRPVRTARRLRRGQPPPASRQVGPERRATGCSPAPSPCPCWAPPTARSSSPAPATKGGAAASPRSWST